MLLFFLHMSEKSSNFAAGNKTTYTMKRLFIILTAALMTVAATAQEQPAAAKANQLVCSGNTYYYGANEVMKKGQMLDWYARHNCQQAYDQFAKGLKLSNAGWVCFGLGLGMDVAAIGTAVAYINSAKTGGSQAIPTGNPLYITAMCLGAGALVLEIASIPMLAVGYSQMHSSVDVYNVVCKTASARPYWTLQASSNGLGLAMKF